MSEIKSVSKKVEKDCDNETVRVKFNSKEKLTVDDVTGCIENVKLFLKQKEIKSNNYYSDLVQNKRRRSRSKE